jgi:hypothetical protein
MAENETIDFEYGDPENPRGNAFAYWRLVSDVDGERFERIIAANFVASPLFLGRQSIAATFPPQIVESYELLLAIARKAGIDLILVEEVELPLENFDFEVFFREQLARFNRVVAAYLRQYSFSLRVECSVDSGAEPEFSEIRGIRDIKRLTHEARRFFLVHRNNTQARKALLRIRKIANTLNSPTRKYDVEDLLALLNNPDERVEELASLYHRKFVAICTERYEEAAKFKRAIRFLSRRISHGISARE